MKISYDGSRFFGYQKQSNLLTVQGLLEKTLFNILGHKVKVIGAGRTDRDVHAIGQVINFVTNSYLPLNKIISYTDKSLGDSIFIRECKEVDINFHSRLSAKRREYLYRIKRLEEKNSFNSRYFSFVKDLNVTYFERELNKFVGRHDFRYFSVMLPKGDSSIRRIISANIIRNYSDKCWDIHIEGEAFLRGMIRVIIGTILSVIEGSLEGNFIETALLKGHSSKKRRASPNGLYLLDVKY